LRIDFDVLLPVVLNNFFDRRRKLEEKQSPVVLLSFDVVELVSESYEDSGNVQVVGRKKVFIFIHCTFSIVFDYKNVVAFTATSGQGECEKKEKKLVLKWKKINGGSDIFSVCWSAGVHRRRW